MRGAATRRRRGRGNDSAGCKGTEADLVTESVQLGQQYLAEPCGVLRKPALILAEKVTPGL